MTRGAKRKLKPPRGAFSRRGFIRALGGLPIIRGGDWLPPRWKEEDRMHLPRRVLYYGVDAPLPEQIPLRAGPLSLVFEAGDLRCIRLGGREILRRVYVAIRDRNWGTVPPRLSNLNKETGPDSFRISYDVENLEGDIDFFWKGTIVGTADGTITFSMDGEARSTFLKSRVGFCVLHPIRECAGQPCVVENSDGKREPATFPRYISPQQPFLDLRAISHEVLSGVTAEVRFEGDVFETEDQRNWTDASYKTYCTPLRLPFPVELKAGTKVSQSITLNLKSAVPPPPAKADEKVITFSMRDAQPVALPRLGLGMATHAQALSLRAIERLRALHLAHFRVDLDLTQASFPAQLHRAKAVAGELGVPLEIAVFLSDAAESELQALRAILDPLKPEVAAWLIFHVAEESTSEKWVRLARQTLADFDPRAKMSAGTNAYFAQLNRGRPVAGAWNLVNYSVNPQVHAFDNASMVENLEGQASTVESARQFVGGAQIAVTPVTLRPRFNPDATGPQPAPAPGELPAQVDVRQMSLFGAAWTAGSIKCLAESGAYSATYYEITGWRGVMETESGSPNPAKFQSLPGAVFPLYHVLADVGEFAGGEVLPSTSDTPLTIDGLVLRKGSKVRTVLVNFTDQEQNVRVIAANLGDSLVLKSLDETNVEVAMTSPESFRKEPGREVEITRQHVEIELRPFAIVRIDRARAQTAPGS
jgi:hypothetical protein